MINKRRLIYFNMLNSHHDISHINLKSFNNICLDINQYIFYQIFCNLHHILNIYVNHSDYIQYNSLLYILNKFFK